MGRSIEPMQTDLPYRRIDNHALLAVRLTPKAKEDAILGVEQFGSERVLRARVRAVPQQGCANEALERLIAKWLGLPPSSVAVVQGGKSRMKHRCQIARRRGSHPPLLSASAAPRAARGCLSGDRAGQSALALTSAHFSASGTTTARLTPDPGRGRCYIPR